MKETGNAFYGGHENPERDMILSSPVFPRNEFYSLLECLIVLFTISVWEGFLPPWHSPSWVDFSPVEELHIKFAYL